MLWCFFLNELSAAFPISNIEKEDWHIYFLYPMCFFPAQDLYLSPWTCVRSYAGHPGFTWPALYWESKPQAAFWPFHASPSNMLKLLCGLEFTFFDFSEDMGIGFHFCTYPTGVGQHVCFFYLRTEDESRNIFHDGRSFIRLWLKLCQCSLRRIFFMMRMHVALLLWSDLHGSYHYPML